MLYKDQTYPLSSQQKMVWFDNLLSEGLPSYNIGMALVFKAKLNLAVLEQAVQQVIAERDVLRVHFQQSNQEVVQHFSNKSTFTLSEKDFSKTENPEKSAWQYIDQQFKTAFDIFAQSPWKIEWVNAGATSYLFFCFHHLVLDGLSHSLIYQLIIEKYNQLIHQTPLTIEHSTIPLYSDYISNDQQYFASTRYKKDKEYWFKRFNNIPEAIFHSHEKRNEQHNGGYLVWQLNRDFYTKITHSVNQLGTSNTQFLMAMLSVIFSKSHFEQKDFVLGMPIHNRTTAEQKSLMGMLSSVLPINIEVELSGTFDELIKKIGAELKRSYRHHRFPVSEIHRHLDIVEAGQARLFDVLLSVEDHAGEETFNGVPFTVVPLDNGYAHHPLTVALRNFHQNDHVLMEFNFDTSVLDTAFIEKLITQLENVFLQLIENPFISISDIQLLDDSERELVTNTFNQTSREYPTSICIHQQFEQQVIQNPQAIAAVFEHQQLTYAELNTRANQVAHYLINECGLNSARTDSLVGLCTERSLDMIIGMLGILKAGGAYVPLDPDYPENRLAYMLEDAELSVILTQQHIENILPEHNAKVICLDSPEVQSTLAQYSNDNPSIEQLSSNNLAYVIYTSGSTGKPKGVMVEHQALVNRIDWMQNQYQATANDNILQKTPFSFDVSVWEFFWPLTVGAKLVFAKPQGHKEPDYLVQLIQQENITKLHFVPSMLSSMLSLHSITNSGLANCTSIQQVFCSGEALAVNHAEQFFQQCAWAELHNLYGPTEAAIDVSYWQCKPEQQGLTSIPIGQPIQNTQLYVLDKQLGLCATGAIGELHIGGVGLARGYLNRDELTQEKFIKNPFYQKSDSSNQKINTSTRLYKTGDLVRWLPDGNLQFLGRIDHQVKVRGFRIELGEIEAAILSVPEISETVVVAIDEPKRVVAYVVTEHNSEADNDKIIEELTENLRQHLTEQLPEHMVPSAFVVLEELPLTSNGKVDRKALPKPELNQNSNQYVAPRNTIERMLCEIWQNVLGVEQVGITDNFFHLGGHSLLVIQLIAQLQQQGYGADVKDVFASKTLEGFAQYVRQDNIVFQAPDNGIPDNCQHITPEMLPLVALSQEDIDAIGAAIPGGMANIQDIYPLAPLQEGMLFHHQLDPDNDPYVLPSLLKLNDQAQLPLLIKALEGIIARHDVLRTAFLWQDLPVAVQIVQRKVELVVEQLVVDTNLPIVEQLEALVEPTGQTMELNKAPLLTLGIAPELEGDGCYLVLKLHHLVLDHTGFQIITDELQAFCNQQAHLLPETTPYREFIAQTLWKAEQVDSSAYFKAMLADVDEVTAPFALTDVHGDGGDIIEANGPLDIALSLRIRQVSQQQGFSPAVLFHTAFAMLLSQTSHRDDVVFGTLFSGRLQGTQNAGQILGLFINTLPIRVSLNELSVQHVISAVQTSLNDLLIHEQTPLSLAQQCSGLDNNQALFTALLNYRHSEKTSTEQITQALDLEMLAGQERTNYPFSLSVDDYGDDFYLAAQIDGDVDPNRVLAYLSQALDVLVDALMNGSEQAIRTLSILPVAEREQLLTEFNHTAVDYPVESCVHQLFEKQVAKTPDAIAVIWGDSELTYTELNRQANQVARYLIDECHVKPDNLIGLCVERSLDMIIGMLGILKAGGAYVPLDPSYPESRLAYMLDDASLSVLVTQTHLQARLPNHSAKVVQLDSTEMQKQLSGYSSENITIDGLTSSHLAYAIYTSGSTGQPKASLLEHKGLCNLVTAQSASFEVTQNSRVLQFASFSFDAASSEWGMALTQGATLCLIAQPLMADIAALEDEVQRLAISHVTLPPALLPSLTQAKWASVSHLVVAGDHCSLALAQTWSQGRNFYNAYGPSEATVCSNISRFNAEQNILSIGKFINNVQGYVLDNQLKPCVIGAIGELHLGGVGLARGYLNRDELTQDRFIHHPFSDDADARLYKTGDLVRWLPDGHLQFLGRIDHQVKIRGFRIELGEIEAAITSSTVTSSTVANQTLTQITEAVVVAVDEPKRVVAYIVAADSIALSDSEKDKLVDALRTELNHKLPDYMVPSAFMVLAALPLTPNGKLDRKALPTPDVMQYQTAYVAPSTELEITLCQIWQEILGVEQVGMTDNFFHLGGHSLLVVKLLSELKKSLDLNLQVKDLFGFAVLSEMSAYIEEVLLLNKNNQLKEQSDTEMEIEW